MGGNAVWDAAGCESDEASAQAAQAAQLRCESLQLEPSRGSGQRCLQGQAGLQRRFQEPRLDWRRTPLAGRMGETGTLWEPQGMQQLEKKKKRSKFSSTKSGFSVTVVILYYVFFGFTFWLHLSVYVAHIVWNWQAAKCYLEAVEPQRQQDKTRNTNHTHPVYQWTSHRLRLRVQEWEPLPSLIVQEGKKKQIKGWD